MEILIGILGFILICSILGGIAGYLKNRAIKRRHQEQFQEIQNHNNSNTLLLMPMTQIEYYHSMNMFYGSGGFFFVFILLMALYSIFMEKEPLSNSGNIIVGLVVFVFAYFLLEYVFFHIRLHTGHIRGAVAFNEDAKKFYVFPTLNSDWNKLECKIYNTSELIYTLERYGGSGGHYNAYVFFTKDEEFAFKVGDLKKNQLDEKLKYMVQTSISIPFKYKYHTDLYMFLAIFFSFILTLLLVKIFD